MSMKEGLVKALFVAALSVVGWGMQYQFNNNHDQENRITVLEESKADKVEVNELKIQMTRQTVILENQSKLMEQQYGLLKEVMKQK